MFGFVLLFESGLGYVVIGSLVWVLVFYRLLVYVLGFVALILLRVCCCLLCLWL